MLFANFTASVLIATVMSSPPRFEGMFSVVRSRIPANTETHFAGAK
jgi:hypothetical protein